MKIILVRHGEPDYSRVIEKGFTGHGFDLAPLSENGAKQIEVRSKDILFWGSQLILSSPYTRALQTAAILSRNLQLKIHVEVDLHEWLADLTLQYDNRDYINAMYDDYKSKGGVPQGSEKWETKKALRKRAFDVFDRYKDCGRIIVAAHGNLIDAVTGGQWADYGTAIEIDY